MDYVDLEAIPAGKKCSTVLTIVAQQGWALSFGKSPLQASQDVLISRSGRFSMRIGVGLEGQSTKSHEVNSKVLVWLGKETSLFGNVRG